MPSASYQSASDRRRAIAFFLALLLEVLVGLALWKLGSFAPRVPEPKSEPAVFQMAPSPVAQKATPKPRSETKKRVADAAAPPVRQPIPVPPKPPIVLPNILNLNREDFAATDISKLPARPDVADGDDEGKGQDSVAAYGPGEGPGGERLYNAEWVREPTHAELAMYMPKGLEEGSAMIACRTVEKFHVENCRSLGESPIGSGLARGLREAAWQFLVRPPRIGGKPQIGALVRIRFDLKRGVTR